MKDASSFFYPWPQTHRPERPHNWWRMLCPYPAAEAGEAAANELKLGMKIEN